MAALFHWKTCRRRSNLTSSHQRDKTSSFRVQLLRFTPVLIELPALKHPAKRN
jgi:hypothetical protein